MIAARLRRTPAIVHEQNAVLGKANRWVLDDGSHRYLVQAYDSDNNGTVDAIQVLDPHPLLGQRGSGFLLTGTVINLADNQTFSVTSHDDVIVRGNIKLLGANSSLSLQSDHWIYWEGEAQVSGNITLLGGVNANGSFAPAAGSVVEASDSNPHGVSVYVHAASQLVSSGAGSHIVIDGGDAVELHGLVVAGGSLGSNGVVYAPGGDATLSVKAGEYVLVDKALSASKPQRQARETSSWSMALSKSTLA